MYRVSKKNYLSEIFDHGCLHGSLLYNSSLWQERVGRSSEGQLFKILTLSSAILRSCTERIHASTHNQKFQKGSFFWDTLYTSTISRLNMIQTFQNLFAYNMICLTYTPPLFHIQNESLYRQSLFAYNMVCLTFMYISTIPRRNIIQTYKVNPSIIRVYMPLT